jgi:hypothetical protein
MPYVPAVNYWAIIGCPWWGKESINIDLPIVPVIPSPHALDENA